MKFWFKGLPLFRTPYKVTKNKEQTHYHLLHRQVVLKSGCMLELFGEFLKY